MALDVGTAIAYLDLDITAFNSGLQQAQTALNTFSDSASTIGDKFTALGGTLANVGSSLTQTLTTPIVNFGTEAINSYRSFESAFTGVKKTTDTSAESLKVFGGTADDVWRTLTEEVERLATSTASSAEEVAGVMEVAGQLGVPLGKAGQDLSSFTQTMIMLGDSTNLSAEEAATALAKFANITGTSWGEVENLGSAIVDLGNNFATQESDIVNMSMRLASAGTVSGLTQQEILALSTAMSSVGINAEYGGSAMSQTLNQIEMAVQKAISGDDGAISTMEAFSKVTGMTADEFAQTWETKPIEALLAFLRGLGTLEDRGMSTAVILDELGMTGIRQSNMLRALGLATEVLNDAIDTSNTAWEENTALTHEAEQRYQTLDSQINMLKESWKALQRDLAELIVPALLDIVDTAKMAIEWFRGLDESYKNQIVSIAGVVAAIGPLLMIFGKLITTIGQVSNIYSMVVGLFEKSKSSVKLANDALSVFQETMNYANGSVKTLGDGLTKYDDIVVSATGKTGLFSGAINALKVFFTSTPGVILAVVAAIALIVAAFVDAYKSSEEVRNAVGQLIDVLVRLGKSALEILGALWKLIEPLVKVVIAALSELIQALLPPLVDLLASIVTWLEIIAPAFSFLAEILGGLAGLLGSILIPAFKLVGEVIGWVVEKIAWFIETVGGFVKKLFGLETDFNEAGKKATSGFSKGVDESTPQAENSINALGEKVKNLFSDKLGDNGSVSTVFEEFGQRTDAGYTAGVEAGKQGVLTAVDGMGNDIQTTFQYHTDAMSGIAESGARSIETTTYRMNDNLTNDYRQSSAEQELIQSQSLAAQKQNYTSYQTQQKADTVATNNYILSNTQSSYSQVQSAVDDSYTSMNKTVNDYTDNTVKSVDKVSTSVSDMGSNIGVASDTLWDPFVTVTHDSLEESSTDLQENLVKMENQILEYSGNFHQAASTLWGEFLTATDEYGDIILDRVRSIMNDINNMVSSARNSMSTMNSYSGYYNGYHAAGLDYVPFNGYMAQLHEGERVLTKQENREYVSGNGNNGSGGDTFIFYDTKPDPYEYARQMKRAKREMAF